MVTITRDKLLHLIHGRENRMLVSVFVSTKMIHQAEFAIPIHGCSEPETHNGDEVVYTLKGSLTITFPKTGESFDVKEGQALLIPERSEHQYFNFTDQIVKAVFFVAPEV